MRFTTSELASATGGVVFGRETEVDGVGIDSRRIQSGQLFVPIVAERDGHDFIGAAVEAGAGAYLTSSSIEAGTAIQVSDTAVALSAIGGRARSRLADRVVAITGSVGKTSLKDLLAAAAATTWSTTASVGSFNNALGVPLTLANAPDNTGCTVVEMGARGVGHIASLCEVARPTVGVVTVVAGVHLELFRSLDDVARGKGELVQSLPSTGTAILNADDDRVAAMAQMTDASVVTFGRAGRGDVQAVGVVVDDDLQPRFGLRSPWGSVDVHLAARGVHQVTNALGAAAASLAMGADIEAVAVGLGEAHLSAMRMDLRTTPTGVRVLDDAYNANPTSMRAALDALAALDGARRFAVLGTMAELGPDSAAEHAAIGAYAQRLGLTVIAVGEAGFGATAENDTADVDEAASRLRSLELERGDAVLVKASRSVGLERLVSTLHTH